MTDRDHHRYMDAAHAMQSAVALAITRAGKDGSDGSIGSPKDLRVGVNAAMADARALARLLIDKGIFTEDEYVAAVADSMEEEARDRADDVRGGDDRIRFA